MPVTKAITYDRKDFARTCFSEGARIKTHLYNHNWEHPYEILILGGFSTMKSLAADAIIAALADRWTLDDILKRQEMLFESVKLLGEEQSDDDNEEPSQDASEGPLFKFLTVNDETTCIIFASDGEFQDDYVGNCEKRPTEGKQIIYEILKDYEFDIKETDLKRIIVITSGPYNLTHDGTDLHIKVLCPLGVANKMRHLTFTHK
jgi:hypothetical protein